MGVVSSAWYRTLSGATRVAHAAVWKIICVAADDVIVASATSI
ncbi:MAG: hypothetical protein OIF57_16500 [Marinobacterium sp.]|nr:hypothetical protein [Marinobacterium sp.]